MLFLLWMMACEKEITDPGLPVEQIASLVRQDVPQKPEWASAVRSALVSAGMVPNLSNACQVLAIIEQESGYKADPPVPGLAKVVRAEVDAKFEKLGLLAKPVREMVLSPIPEGSNRSFDEQLSAVKTERDVDELFRAILAHHEQKAPQVADVLHSLFPRKLDSFNPVETAGSMQVSVSWAQGLGRREGLSAEEVRERLYTLEGGVKYGTARLFAHDVDKKTKQAGGPYDAPIFRFADYNAGLFTARNANFQEALSRLLGERLTPDGDLLQWTDGGRPKGKQDGETVRALDTFRERFAPDLSRDRMLRDLQYEKSAYFEETDTWKRVRETYKARFAKEAAYARMPDVALDSPKLRKDLTTEWFATNVNKRYEACLARGR